MDKFGLTNTKKLLLPKTFHIIKPRLAWVAHLKHNKNGHLHLQQHLVRHHNVILIIQHIITRNQQGLWLMHTAAAALRDKVLTSSGNILELLSKVFQSKTHLWSQLQASGRIRGKTGLNRSVWTELQDVLHLNNFCCDSWRQMAFSWPFRWCPALRSLLLLSHMSEWTSWGYSEETVSLIIIAKKRVSLPIGYIGDIKLRVTFCLH